VPTVSAASAIAVSPNPTADHAVVQLEGRNDLYLMSSKGELVWSTSSVVGAVRIDLTPFPTGIYLLRVAGASAGTTRIAKW
jgi:hypothetical protein